MGNLGLGEWRIDPGRRGFRRRFGSTVDETFRVLAAGAIEGVLAGGVDRIGLAIMDLIWRHKADPNVVMVLVVPVEIMAQEAPRVLNTAKALGKLRLILQILELAFRERIVIGRVRAAVRADHAEIGKQQRRRFGLHRPAAISMQRELAERNMMFCDRVIEEWLEKCRRFGIGHTPANNPAAEDIEDDVKIEIRPFRRPHQFGNVPRPDLVGSLRQQFRLLIDRVAQLSAAFANLGMLREDAIHGADRAVVDVLIEQRCIDFRRCLVHETWGS